MPTSEPDGYQVIRIPKTGIQLPEITDSPLLETMTLAVNVLFKISMWPGSTLIITPVTWWFQGAAPDLIADQFPASLRVSSLLVSIGISTSAYADTARLLFPWRWADQQKR